MTDDRVRIPSDPEGRSWVQSFPDVKAPDLVRRCIAVLLGIDDQGELQMLGTAFVIGASGASALCMCAAHSLDPLKTYENAGRQAPTWLPPDLVLNAPQYLSASRLKAAFILDGEALICEVDQLNYIDGHDVALITVMAPEGRELFHNNLGMDLAVPSVGTEVAVLGFEPELDRRELGSGVVELKLQMRHGVVTERLFRRTMPGQSFTFLTTIPVPKGMSGAPVVIAPGEGKPAICVGVVSSDISEEGAFTNYMMPGRSSISMLWPAVGLGIAGATVSGETRYHSLLEMMKGGFVDDRTAGATVSLTQSRAKTAILYQDDVGDRVLLETIGHPAVPE